VVNQQPTLNWDLGDTSGTVAVRMPMHPAAIELLKLVGPMAVSSANKTEQSPALNIQMATDQLGESVKIFLDGGTTSYSTPSTILDLTGEKVRVIRIGALGLDEIREVIPDVIPPDGVEHE
jgi:tRNA threonylcarbamoyl adenosine modification protein (Sua5/YciO/YrdC/YwlC family)